jgi:hypothetical protein
MLPKVLVDKGGIDAAEGDWQLLLQHIEAN